MNIELDNLNIEYNRLRKESTNIANQIYAKLQEEELQHELIHALFAKSKEIQLLMKENLKKKGNLKIWKR